MKEAIKVGDLIYGVYQGYTVTDTFIVDRVTPTTAICGTTKFRIYDGYFEKIGGGHQVCSFYPESDKWKDLLRKQEIIKFVKDFQLSKLNNEQLENIYSTLTTQL